MIHRKKIFTSLRSTLFYASIFICATILLAGCGHDSDNASFNNPPVAVIALVGGAAVPGQTLTLDGSGSLDPDGDKIVSYMWTQTSSTGVDISGKDQPTAKFTIPDVTTTLVFELVVTDEFGLASEPARISVPVTSTNITLPPPSGKYIIVSAAEGMTIQQCLDEAVAQGITNVYVKPGIYVESVKIPGNMNLYGNLENVAEDGTPTFYSLGEQQTVITAPDGEDKAVLISGVRDVVISGLKFEGAKGGDVARAVVIEGSGDVTIHDSTFTTPGAAGVICRDLDVTGSENITLNRTFFENSGTCEDYIAVALENSVNTKIVSADGNKMNGNEFAFIGGGNEKYMKAIQSVGGSNIEISNSNISTGNVALSLAEPLPVDVVFSAITVEDTQDALIASNNVVVSDGGAQVTGVSLRCTNTVLRANVQGNLLKHTGASTKETGVRLICYQPASSINLSANTVVLEPAADTVMDVRGFDADAVGRSINFSTVNNLVYLSAAQNDKATKTAVRLSRFGSQSKISVFYNELGVAGNDGELHAVYSDRDNVKFSAIDNLFFVYGFGNTNNSVFALKKACAANYCAKDILSNLFNKRVATHDVQLVYFYDTAEKLALATANECSQNPPPDACSNGSIAHEGNYIEDFNANSFDGIGTPSASLLGLMKDRGRAIDGVVVDMNSSPRGASSDIGPIEQ